MKAQSVLVWVLNQLTKISLKKKKKVKTCNCYSWVTYFQL